MDYLKEYQWLRVLLLCLIWDLLSCGQLLKIIGPAKSVAACLLFNLVAGSAFLLAQMRPASKRPQFARWGLAGVWVFVAAAYFFLHPLSARHVFGPGSDRENAIEVASHALFHGHFPYHEVTFLQHPITPMPGALLFASPFYLLGQVGLQNVVWLAAFLFWIYRLDISGSMKVWYATVFAAFSPCIMQDFVTGGEFFTNFVYVVVLMTLVFHVVKKYPESFFSWTIPALFGIALASRPIYSLAYPCLLAFVWQLSGLRVAIRTVLLALVGEFGVTLPVYLRDPAHFVPFQVGSNAYALIPAALHPAAVVFALGLLVSATALLVRLNLRRVLLILGAALTVVTLPLFVVDQIVKPELFPLYNLIYLSPGLLLLAIWLLPSSGSDQSDRGLAL